MNALARRSHATVPDARPALYDAMGAAVAPRPVVTVSAWAERERWLSSKASGASGWYRTARTPHLREIMDSLSAHSPVQRVTVMKPAQGGVTELSLNWIGYVMRECPAPMLVVVPTLELRQRWVKQRLDPMLAESPQLAALFDARRSRDASNTESLKDYPGGMLLLGGANSPASLSSMPIRFVVCDEVDRFPWEVGHEGDPLGLIDERTKAFPRRKVLLISTPTTKGASRIAQEYAASDMRRLHVPCPHCGAYILLRWRHDDGELGLQESAITGRVWYVCRDCGAGIEEHHKTHMLAAGKWIPQHPNRPLHRGYHWNGLYAPIGLGFTWREMLDQWRAAQDDTSKLKRFTNTGLGEVWEEVGQSLDDVALLARAETYPPDRPRGLRIGAVDVQKDRLELSVYEFIDHGAKQDEEAWALDHQVLPGDTTDGHVWEDLAAALDESGVCLTGIDAGYNTQMVNAFVEKRSWCVALKGIEGMNRPLVEDERKRRMRLRQRRRKGVPSEPIGVDMGKAMVHQRLRRDRPGPGYIHFPEHPAFDAEFFAQLGAEALVPKARNGRVYHEWVKTRPRNEALDCAVYALATYHLAKTVRPRQPPAPEDASRAEPVSPAKPPASSVLDVGRGTGPALDHFGSDRWSSRL